MREGHVADRLHTPYRHSVRDRQFICRHRSHTTPIHTMDAFQMQIHPVRPLSPPNRVLHAASCAFAHTPNPNHKFTRKQTCTDERSRTQRPSPRPRSRPSKPLHIHWCCARGQESLKSLCWLQVLGRMTGKLEIRPTFGRNGRLAAQRRAKCRSLRRLW